MKYPLLVARNFFEGPSLGGVIDNHNPLGPSHSRHMYSHVLKAVHFNNINKYNLIINDA